MDISTCAWFLEFEQVCKEFCDAMGDLGSILNLQRTANESVQKQLSDSMRSKKMTEAESRLVESSPSTPQRVLWFRSICNKEAGMWLEAIPYCPKFRIQSCEYRAALRQRMF